ncbi:MAG TPA: mechanosensitive ion channel domain-containing protein [Mycobacteriales bacterium]|nr:mechanosensitive ion channel domain-containing protein [Mycobacteriales bacterium]
MTPTSHALGDAARDALLNAGRCAFVVLLAVVLVGIARRAIPRALRRVADSSRLDERMELRTRTLSGLVVSTISVVVWSLAIVTLLAQVGVQIGPLLAGAGVVGLAVGFGAQQLVRDVISGFFVLVEDQYSVGDSVAVGGVDGIVESVSLRLTRIRGEDGVLHHVRNGDLEVVSNFSRGFSVATVKVPLPAGVTARDAAGRSTQAMAALVVAGEVDGLLLADPQVLGVDVTTRADGSQEPYVSISARVTVDGRNQVRRVLLREAMAALEDEPVTRRASGRGTGSAARRR